MAVIDKRLLPCNLEGDLVREGKGCLELLKRLMQGLPCVPEEEPEIVFDDKVERVHYRGRARRLSEEWLHQLVARLLKERKRVLAYSIALLYDLDRHEEIAAKARKLAEEGDEIAIAAHRAISWAMEILRSGGTPDAAYHRAIKKSVAPERRSIKNPELRRDYDEAIESYENRPMEAVKLGEYREIGGKKEIVLYLNAIFRANALNHAPWTQRIGTPQGLEEVLSVYAHEYFHFLHHYYSESNGAGGRIVRESLATYFQCLRDKEAGRRDMDLIDYCGVHNPYVYPYSGALCLEEDPAVGQSRLGHARLSGDDFFREVFLESAEEEEGKGSAERLLLHREDFGSKKTRAASPKPPRELLIAYGLDAFRADLIKNGKTPRTASSYISYVKGALTALDDGNFVMGFCSLDEVLLLARKAIEETEREIKEPSGPRNLNSLKSRLSALRAYYEWLSANALNKGPSPFRRL